jgi:hypothetical protein
MKIRPVGASCSKRTDGRTDRLEEVISHFWQFYEIVKKNTEVFAC